jgi:hypothetical protein
VGDLQAISDRKAAAMIAQHADELAFHAVP